MVAVAAPALPGVERDSKPVVFTTAPKDKKLYRRITLQNGLLAILICDPEMANQLSGGSESEEDMSEGDSASEVDEDDEVNNLICIQNIVIALNRERHDQPVGHGKRRGRRQHCSSCTSQESSSSYGSWSRQF